MCGMIFLANIQEVRIDEACSYFPGIAFHGTKGTWAETAVIKKLCAERNLPLYITEDANHSMETGSVAKDLENMQTIMAITEEYLKMSI